MTLEPEAIQHLLRCTPEQMLILEEALNLSHVFVRLDSSQSGAFTLYFKREKDALEGLDLFTHLKDALSWSS